MYVIIYTYAYKFNLLTFKGNYCILCFSKRHHRLGECKLPSRLKSNRVRNNNLLRSAVQKTVYLHRTKELILPY